MEKSELPAYDQLYPPPTTSPYERGQPTYVSPGPSSSRNADASVTPTPSQSNNFQERIQAFFQKGQDVSQLINPPPPSFQRPPASSRPYGPFGTMVLMGTNKDLEKAFSPLSPPSASQPHPFATHDINQEDWERFLHDVRIAAGLSPRDQIVANVAPMTMGLGLTGFLVTKGIMKRQKNKKSVAAGELIDQWNYHFFFKRQVRVVLAQGRNTYSGHDIPPPDMNEYDLQQYSDSDSGDEVRAPKYQGQGRFGGGRPSDRRARRMERREERQEHREERRNRRRSGNEPWRLIITYKSRSTS